MRITLSFIAFLIFNFSYAEEELGTIEVIGVSPLPGILIEKEKYPNTSQSIDEEKIKKNLSKIKQTNTSLKCPRKF